MLSLLVELNETPHLVPECSNDQRQLYSKM